MNEPAPIAREAIRIPAVRPDAGIQSFFLPPGTPGRPRIARAEGIWLEDTDGRRYLDVSSGPVASNLGHGNPRVLAALERQARAAAFAFPMQFESAANIELGERLARLCGPGFERAFLVSGGSEAVETAIKFCRQHAVVRGEPQRWKVIGREPGYHGNTLGALAVSGDAHAHEVFGPLLRAVDRVPAPFTYRLPPNHTADSHARACAQALDDAIRREGPETVLAFIMEPVGGLATGALVAPDAYYAMVREICSRHGVLLIYDEVMSGAGRTGAFLAADHWPGVRPDIVVLAKGVTAGYTPMGVMMAPAGMADTLARAGGFMQGFTYFANPLSCAVGAAVLAEMEERDLIGNARRMGALLRGRLDALMRASPLVGDVRGLGLLLAIEIVADKATKTMVPLERMAPYRLQALGLRHGLALYCRRTNRGTYGDWMMISPPLTVTEDEIDLLVERLGAVLDDYAAELRADGVI
ncbi:MAG: aspartate aminotransferase family protein [Alphaproteobacteria bacterium]